MDIQDSVGDYDRELSYPTFVQLASAIIYCSEISHKCTPGITNSLKCLEDEIQTRWPLYGVIVLMSL